MAVDVAQSVQQAGSGVDDSMQALGLALNSALAADLVLALALAADSGLELALALNSALALALSLALALALDFALTLALVADSGLALALSSALSLALALALDLTPALAPAGLLVNAAARAAAGRVRLVPAGQQRRPLPLVLAVGWARPGGPEFRARCGVAATVAPPPDGPPAPCSGKRPSYGHAE